MRILIVSPYLPHSRIGHGGGTAVRDLIRELSRRHEVCLVSLLRPGEAELTDEIATGVTVETVPFRDRGVRGPGRLLLAAGRLAAL